jgi:hypothetical protein
MSLFSKERTYEFSLEGLALMRADANWYNKINDYNLLISGLALGISIIGVCVLLSPIADLVAYKIIEADLIPEVAYKVIEGVL